MSYPFLFVLRQPLQPNAGRAKNAIVLCRIVSVVMLLGIVLNISLLRSTDTGGNLSDAAMLVQSAFSFIYFITLTLLAVFFLLWMQRAYSNLHRTRISGLSHTPGWVTASWFIPFVRLYRPRELMQEIWDKTQTAYRPQGSFVPENSGIVSYWWGTFITAQIAYAAGVYFSIHTNQFEYVYFFTILVGAAGLLSVLYGMRMIRKIAAFETAMQERAATSDQSELARYAENYRRLQEENPFLVSGEHQAVPVLPAEETEDFLSGDFVENTDHSRFVRISLYGLLPMLALYGVISFLLFSSMSEADFRDQVISTHQWLNIIFPTVCILFAVCILAFILWMYRSYQNLSHIRIIPFTTFGPAMAIAGWLIPFLNFVMPLLMFLELAEYIPRSLIPPESTAEKKGTQVRLINIAWLTGLCGFLLQVLASALTDSSSLSFRSNQDAALFSFIAAILGCTSVSLMIKVMREFSKAENELFERVEKLAALIPDPEEEPGQAAPDENTL